MSGPAAVPTLRPTGPSVVRTEWRASFREMASPVSVVLGPGCTEPDRAFAKVVGIFADVSTECTRFDEASDLMRANRSASLGATVGPYCIAALREAELAHRSTDGWFEPRVLGRLVELGYAASVESGRDGGAVDTAPIPGEPWSPAFDEETRDVRIGPVGVDLGGIAKGLAVRWSAQAIAPTCPSFLIEAGGDLVAHGTSPDGTPWRIAVEDPRGGDRPLAVLALRDTACATSSVRRGRWRHEGRQVHHLLDPWTGEPGGAGLLAVTVVDPDPATAEVWSKVFFLHGAERIAAKVANRNASALWVGTDGTVRMSAAMQSLVMWQDGA